MSVCVIGLILLLPFFFFDPRYCYYIDISTDHSNLLFPLDCTVSRQMICRIISLSVDLDALGRFHHFLKLFF